MMRAMWVMMLLAGGCINLKPQQDPTQFYVLEGVRTPEPASVVGILPGLSIGLRRLHLAEYLGNPRIAVRRGTHRVTYAEYHRWGESLDQGISRSLASLVAARGPFARVDVVPWPSHAQHDYVVQVDVQRFEGQAEEGALAPLQRGEVHLLATWEIIRDADREIVARGTVNHRIDDWATDDYEELVAMLADALDALAEDLAAGFRGLPARPPGRQR
jgi:uncharacterized protein